MPRRRSLLRTASRDYEVYFMDIESVLDRLRDIFKHLIYKLISEIQEDIPGHSHRIRLVLNAPTLNYPIHIPFSSADDFNAELVLNEIDRVVNSNEAFDISNNIKVNVLSVSLPAMGGKRIGGIQSRTVPDIKLFTKQKKSVIVIKSFKNDCLIKALAIGKKVCQRAIVEPLAKNTKKNFHLDRASTQMREMQILMRALEEDPSFDEDRLSAFGSSKQELLEGNCSEATLTSSTDPFTSEQTLFIEPFFLDDLHYLSSTNILSKFCISVYDSNFMGAFLKCYNPNAVHHIDFFYDAKNCHVDVITSMKGLFDARQFCYSCRKAFSTVKHLCAASGCMLCRQPGCLNRTGFINLSPMNITTTTTTTTTSSSQGSFQSKSMQFQCDRCRLKLRTEKCLDCHVSSGICHLYTLCPSCNNTVAKRAL